MEQAWLDSLSEDWVSQPRSSGSPAPSLPSLMNSTTDSSNVHPPSSRIPKYNSQKQSWAAGFDSSNALAERSPNDNNIPLSQRGTQRSSKLRSEISGSTRGRLTRTASASNTQSTQYHTVQHHKSVSLSPKKVSQETPEWKRRLLQGDVAYGEQRDLFSPAGLENIFRPPPNSPVKAHPYNFEEASIMMPSSPPPYNVSGGTHDAGPSQDNGAKRQQPPGMKYKMTDPNQLSSEFSADDLSRSSSFLTLPNAQKHGRKVSSEAASHFVGSVARQLLNGERRIVSGQSDFRNEELSPIYVARHNNVDGKIDYAAVDLSATELQERLEAIRHESTFHSTGDSGDTTQVLPGDMTVETDDFAHNGRFVNLRRGGQSQEGSFQRRMLSPSSLPAIDESVILPEDSMQASTPKQLPNIRKTRASNEYPESRIAKISPPVPGTPHPSPSKPDDKGTKSSTGSPLKLFGTYDTFTNQTLLRRLRSFEDSFERPEEEYVHSSSSQELTRPELNEAFVAQSSGVKTSQTNMQHSSRKVNSFGAGELDSFRFSEEVSYDSTRSIPENEDKEIMSLPILDPAKQTKFKFQLDPSPTLQEGVIQQRTKAVTTKSTIKHIVRIRRTTRHSTGSSEDTSALPSSQRLEDLATPRKRIDGSEGKRLPKSPLKYPTPKRRRTLRETEIAYQTVTAEDADLDSLRDVHQQMQSVIGKKRKDARHDDDQQAANPKVLAMRQILRPRTPTPSQRSSQQRDKAPHHGADLTSAERAKVLQEEKIAKIQAELDSTDLPKLATAHGISQQMHDDSRKGSVTTQDFLDEAKKIMAGIRGKSRPRSGLASLEESESENDRNVSIDNGTQNGALEDSYQESTKEPFSRPPSREGGPLPRLPKQQQDPALLDHLRKYEEMSDMDDIIASSIKSIAMARSAADSDREIDRMAEQTISRASGLLLTHEQDVHSDPPNIRIIENPDMQRKRKHSTSSAPANSDEQHDFPSQGSNASSGQSTSRSIPTGSSRGSDSRRVIAPHTVSHLIPEQLAGMVFDRERNIWIKRKTVSGESGVINFLPSDGTDDDPFGDIPDLSVDETQELQRTKAAAARRKDKEQSLQTQHNEGSKKISHQKTNSSNGTLPILNDTGYLAENLASPEPSKLTKFGSTETTSGVNTRLTSWGDDYIAEARVPSASEERQRVHRSETSSRTKVVEEVIEEVEREISILEDRIDPPKVRRSRNVTISFSSPLASIIQPSAYADDNSEEQADDASQSDNEDRDFGNDSVIITKRGISNKGSSAKTRSTLRNASRRISLAGHTFSARPVSRIEERDERSFVATCNDGNRRSVSIVVSTPRPQKKVSSLILATPQPTHEVGTLELTPLSDFTMLQADESFGLNVSYVAERQRYVSGGNAKRTLSLSIKELVERLTEVEPYEPFWEHIKEMDLSDKKLTNLHKLDEFCEQLQELDVSKNQISQLMGAPPSIRRLRITHNCLSDLTAWGHLMNLQYIDISNNEIESLSAFKYLIHLRSLRADNNKIKSLEGIEDLDGLLSLRLRRNQVELLDFKNTKLTRLSDLDLNSNRVCDIKDLQDLHALSKFSLEDNDLSVLDIHSQKQPSSLKYLKLSGNNLTTVDVSQCPNLRLLYLDRNRLGTVIGLLKTRHLDSLSLREQKDGAFIDQTFLSEAYEVRKLFLSGNLLDGFKPKVNFLNLQYLELANCGLETLPKEFGQMVLNTRVLNLNFNALKDITPLFGIVRLKRLHLAGNRLWRLRKTTLSLAYFPTLTSVDLRGNPLTVGFYPPVAETDVVLRESAVQGETDPAEPFTLGKGCAEKDGKYASRLDMETKKMRRVYEILIVDGCTRLRMLDGLGVNKSILSMKDKVWDDLVSAGVIRYMSPENQGKDTLEGGDSTKEGVQEKTSEKKSPEDSVLEERWQAEDSFA